MIEIHIYRSIVPVLILRLLDCVSHKFSAGTLFWFSEQFQRSAITLLTLLQMRTPKDSNVQTFYSWPLTNCDVQNVDVIACVEPGKGSLPYGIYVD